MTPVPFSPEQRIISRGDRRAFADWREQLFRASGERASIYGGDNDDACGGRTTPDSGLGRRAWRSTDGR